jgi:tRNA(Ile2) C34 agmatinyltransferase TiaS
MLYARIRKIMFNLGNKLISIFIHFYRAINNLCPYCGGELKDYGYKTWECQQCGKDS